ncbi:MAG: HU family DNA-binding protein [Bacteriovoracaceae bacterium]|nr:HU family DNA-binding protein [Bacteriovoracaceae bacterium]
MNKKELIDTMLTHQELSHLTRKDVEVMLSTFVETVKKTVKKGDDVSMMGFGTFTKMKRAARNGINPTTGEGIKIKAKIFPKFKPGKEFKEHLS